MRFRLGSADPLLLGRGNAEVLEAFLFHLKGLKMSRKSVKCFRSNIISFEGSLRGKRFAEVSEEDVGRWRQSSGLSRSSLTQYSIRLRQFFRWLGVGVEVVVPPMPENVPISILTAEEQEAMFKAARNPRHRLLVALLWESMMRANEIRGIRPMDVDFGGFKIWVSPEYAKFGRERWAPFGLLSLECFKHFFKSYSIEREDRIFNWSKEGVYAVVERIADRIGFSMNRVHPHVWRHTGITTCLRAGMNPLNLIKLTGHKDVKQLQRYDHLVTDDAMADYGKAFNIEALKKTPEQRQVAAIVSRCPSCDEVLLPSYPVCLNCGYDLTKNLCTSCRKPVDKNWLNCPHCGNKLSEMNRCPMCRQPLMQGWKLCPICATEIAESLTPF